MFKKEERMGFIIHLYYNRDAKKLAHVGDIIYSLKESLSKESYIKKIQTCEIQNLDTNFVGSLFRNQENAII